jgi:putative flippase GtrA
MAPETTTKSKRPLIFLGIGVLNTLLDFGFYSFLTLAILRQDSQIALAGIVSGTFALLCAFLTHSFITWRGSHIGFKTILKFIAFTGFGMWVIRPLLLALFIKLGGLYSWVHDISQTLHLPFSYDFIANTGAFGFMVVIVLVYNYLVYDRFVFNKKTSAVTASSQSEPGQVPDRTEPETRSES